MGAVVVGEGHQDHEHQGHHREDQNAGEGQSEQGLVELIVHQGPKVVLAALELFAGAKDLLRDLVLLDVEAPGEDERHDEEHGEHAVQQDLEGVVAVDGDIGVQELVILLVGPDEAQTGQHAHPVYAVEDHIADEDHLKDEEQQAPQDLAPSDAAEAHDKIGQLGFPIAVDEGLHDVLQLVGDGEASLFEPPPDAQNGMPDGHGDGGKEADEAVFEPFPFGKFQILQIRIFLHTSPSN